MTAAKFLLTLALLLSLCAAAEAKIVTKNVTYRSGDGAVLQGYLVYNDAWGEPRPGVLVMPEWWGLNGYAMQRARELVQLGYAAMAADLYGGGRVAVTNDEAAGLSKPLLQDRQRLRDRTRAALDAFQGEVVVDPGKVAVIGYCFGGSAALEMARASMPVRGVVSFHGGLKTSMKAAKGAVRCPVLAFHGHKDPLVTPEELQGFKDEMDAVGADWQLTVFGQAKHSFTNPEAGTRKGSPTAYHRKSAERSWEQMRLFLREVLGR